MRKRTKKPSPKELLKHIEAAQGQRPYRVYDSVQAKNLPRRAYKTLRSALNHTLIHTKWLPVGTTLQVFDVITSTVYAEYTRRPTSLLLTEHLPAED